MESGVQVHAQQEDQEIHEKDQKSFGVLYLVSLSSPRGKRAEDPSSDTGGQPAPKSKFPPNNPHTALSKPTFGGGEREYSVVESQTPQHI